MVEGIEGFGPKLELEPLGDPEILVQRKINALERGADKNIAAGVAEKIRIPDTRHGPRKGARIKEQSRRHAFGRISCQVGSLLRDVSGVVLGGKRPAGKQRDDAIGLPATQQTLRQRSRSRQITAPASERKLIIEAPGKLMRAMKIGKRALRSEIPRVLRKLLRSGRRVVGG